jgi:hypothetical protein
MRVVLAEKPSVARELAAFLGAGARRDGYLEGTPYTRRPVAWRPFAVSARAPDLRPPTSVRDRANDETDPTPPMNDLRDYRQQGNP